VLQGSQVMRGSNSQLKQAGSLFRGMGTYMNDAGSAHDPLESKINALNKTRSVSRDKKRRALRAPSSARRGAYEREASQVQSAPALLETKFTGSFI